MYRNRLFQLQSWSRNFCRRFSKYVFPPFRYSNTREAIDDGKIVLEIGDRAPIARVVISHAIAQSVKIAAFEEGVEEIVKTVEPLARELQVKGSLKSLSSLSISKRVGALFLLRSQVNFAEIADVPAFLWHLDKLQLDPVHRMIADHLEIRKRVDLVNRRMDIVGYLYEILRDESNLRHASKLEWIVIVLVAMSVVAEMLPYLEQLIRYIIHHS